jgi:hypothetical protein
MIDLTNGLPDMATMPKEGFSRGGRHTRGFDMWLVDRQAPTPPEKLITDTVPFMQGNYDFSDILGERFYDNRTLSYVFEIKNRNYTNRKIVQTSLENWLMKDGFSDLYDDHAEGYYYKAKCTHITTEDATGGLRVTVDFDAYPFKIGVLEEGHDIWDEFNFELDASIVNEFSVAGTQQIDMYNIGSNSQAPILITTAPMTIFKGGITYNVPSGRSQNDSFRLNMGSNPMTITGNGLIKFEWHKELL